MMNSNSNVETNLKSNYILTSAKLSGLLFLLYFCNDIVNSLIARTLGATAIWGMFNILFLIIFLFYCFSSRLKNLCVPILFTIVIFFIVTITMIEHPEYDYWFYHPVYGIDVTFFSLQGGIWAFLVIWLVNNDEDLYKYLNICAFVLFVFYSLQFATSLSRGYWVIHEVTGDVTESYYNLEFGYNMLFPISFFVAVAYLKQQYMYYIPFAMGALMILLGGSRGASLFIPFTFVLMFPLKWENISRNKRLLFVFSILLLIPVLFYVYSYYELILYFIMDYLSSKGLQSRTLMSLVTGSFSEANGRDRIFEIVIELIKTGGPFGRGFYGERIFVGQEFRWGYSHNLFLELLVSFGYIGGSIIILLLLYGIFSLYRKCRTQEQKIVFVTMLVPSLKLLLSNSFWYTPFFWALIAFFFRLKRKKITKERVLKTNAMF